MMMKYLSGLGETNQRDYLIAVFRNANSLIENRDPKRFYSRAEDLRYINNGNNSICVRGGFLCGCVRVSA